MMLWVMTGMMPLGNASDDASGDASGDALGDGWGDALGDDWDHASSNVFGDALGDDWVGAATWLATGRSPDGSRWQVV